MSKSSASLRLCPSCDTPCQASANFCPECGQPLADTAIPASAPPPDSPKPHGNTRSGDTLPPTVPARKLASEELTWEVTISLLTNPLVLRQLAIAPLVTGLIMALLLSFVLAVTGDFQGIPAMLLVSLLGAVGLFVAMLLIMLIFFRRYRVRFTVNRHGVRWQSLDQLAKTGSRLAILAGILGHNPTVVGAGVLAAARETEYVAWHDLADVTYNRRQRMLILRNRWRPVMMVICLPDNYDQVTAYVRHNVAPVQTLRAESRSWHPLPRLLWRTALVTLAATPVFVLANAESDIFVPLILFMFALATVWLIPLFGWVVIGCALFLAGEFMLLFLSGSLYNGWIDLLLPYAGLLYLIWFSWMLLRGRIRSALMED